MDKLSAAEKGRFEAAMEKPEFKQLFMDYMKEISDPATLREREKELAKEIQEGGDIDDDEFRGEGCLPVLQECRIWCLQLVAARLFRGYVLHRLCDEPGDPCADQR